jgi:hypothetical protein
MGLASVRLLGRFGIIGGRAGWPGGLGGQEPDG